MPIMLVRNRVRDFDSWKDVFDAQAEPAGNAGLQLLWLWRDVEDPTTVFFAFAIDDLEAARAYISARESAEVGRRAGVIDGEIHIVEPHHRTRRVEE